MRRLVLGTLTGILALSCASSPAPVAPRAVAPEGTVNLPPAQPSPEAPSRVSKPIRTPHVEPFLTAKDASTAFPERARLRRDGRIGLRRDAADAAPYHDQFVDEASTVLDAGEPGSSGAVRLLCDEVSYRLAVFATRDSLEHVVRQASAIVPRNLAPQPSGRDAVGVHVDVGSVVEIMSTVGDAHRVRFKSDTVEAIGLLPTASVDVIFRAPQKSEEATDAPKPGTAVDVHAKTLVLLDAPRGVPLATISSVDEPNEPIVLRKLGAQRDKHALVAYDEDEEALVVGWVPLSVIAAAKPSNHFGRGTGGFGILGGLAAGPSVSMDKGDLLEEPEGHEVVGIVREQKSARCVRDCATDAPVVELFPCTTTLRVRLRRGSREPGSER